MDPDETLKNVEEALAQASKFLDREMDDSGLDDEELVQAEDLLSDLYESVNALNEWMKSGGFLPKEWQKKRTGPSTDEVVPSVE